jgi:hypothetical protein
MKGFVFGKLLDYQSFKRYGVVINYSVKRLPFLGPSPLHGMVQLSGYIPEKNKKRIEY